MKRRIFILSGCCGILLLAASWIPLSFSRQHPSTKPTVSAAAPEIAPTVMANPGDRSNELHPYIESLRTAQLQGTISQIRNEMRVVVNYCNEQPSRLGEVLQGLASHNAQESETLRLFGEVLMKGRGQPADELIKQTAIAWSKQTTDRTGQRLGFELLAESSSRTNASASENP
jgi:hypothetical protein